MQSLPDFGQPANVATILGFIGTCIGGIYAFLRWLRNRKPKPQNPARESISSSPAISVNNTNNNNPIITVNPIIRMPHTYSQTPSNAQTKRNKGRTSDELIAEVEELNRNAHNRQKRHRNSAASNSPPVKKRTRSLSTHSKSFGRLNSVVHKIGADYSPSESNLDYFVGSQTQEPISPQKEEIQEIDSKNDDQTLLLYPSANEQTESELEGKSVGLEDLTHIQEVDVEQAKREITGTTIQQTALSSDISVEYLKKRLEHDMRFIKSSLKIISGMYRCFFMIYDELSKSNATSVLERPGYILQCTEQYYELYPNMLRSTRHIKLEWPLDEIDPRYFLRNCLMPLYLQSQNLDLEAAAAKFEAEVKRIVDKIEERIGNSGKVIRRKNSAVHRDFVVFELDEK